MAFFIKIGFPENLSGFRVNLENTGSLSSEWFVQHSKLLFFIGLPLADKNFRKSVENPGQGHISHTGIRQEPIFHLLFLNIVDQEP